MAAEMRAGRAEAEAGTLRQQLQQLQSRWAPARAVRTAMCLLHVLSECATRCWCARC